MLVGRVSLRVLRGVDAALDKTRTPLTADIPARAFQIPGSRGCAQQIGGVGSMGRSYENRFYYHFRHIIMVEFGVAK